MAFVQFSDSSEKVVIAVFGCVQDEATFPNQANIDDGDPRYLSFLSPPPIVVITEPLEKLKAFLLANPDVAEILK